MFFLVVQFAGSIHHSLKAVGTGKLLLQLFNIETFALEDIHFFRRGRDGIAVFLQLRDDGYPLGIARQSG